MLFIHVLLPDIRCTPSPKYLSRPRKEKKKVHPVDLKTDVPVEISLSPPVRGFSRSMVANPFGIIKDPIYGTKEYNKGLDIFVECGESIRASAKGEVAYSGRQNGLGWVVIVDHGNRVCTVYARLDTCLVEAGAEVRSGEPIGKPALKGNGETCCFHYEVRYRGKAVDPLRYLRK